MDAARPATRVWLVLHLAILLSVSLSYESLFLRRGLNVMDEGWPLHAAMELHAGKTLYEEVFWVFPPGHLLPAWIAYGLAPPGIAAARAIYASFTVALCVGLYFLARRIMPADFALLAGLMVAVAAPRSHLFQQLFGYRYLVFSVVTLLFFHRRLITGDPRWLLPAGLFAGTAFFFRVTPAIAVTAAVGVATLAADRDWRRWLCDGLWYAAGFAVVSLPVLLYFGASVGLEKLWVEMFARPLEMTDLQSKPFPPLLFLGWERAEITATFTLFAFRFYLALYAAVTAVLLFRWLRAFRRGGVCEDPLLLAVVLWGGIYFLRALGRTDEPHLDSAIPPVIVVVVHLISFSERLPWLRDAARRRSAAVARYAICLFVLAGWIYLIFADRFVCPPAGMGVTRLESAKEEIWVGEQADVRIIDQKLPLIQQYSDPDDTILVMTHAPLLYVLAERHSPGYYDVIMPGTFLSREEERKFLERLKAAPPAVVVWPSAHFDGVRSRGIRRTAPVIGRWILENYHIVGDRMQYMIMVRGQGPTR
jgi:hypothetical protein